MSEFRTRNLGLAGFLAHIGITHLRTQMNDGKSAIFIFDDPYCECDRIKRDYFGGAGCEDAQRFAEMISTVKGTIRLAQHDGLWINDELPGATESREERAA